MARKDIDEKKEQIIEWLKQGRPRFDICRELGCKYDTLLTRINEWGVSHLKNPAGKGTKKKALWVDANKHLINGSNIGSHKLKKYLFRDNIKEKKCEVCGITEWQGKPAPLELHHISGDRFDNRIENLMILCPNCHSQTDNNSGKNVGKYSKGV